MRNIIFLLSLFVCFGMEAQERQKPQHILFILMDDLGYGDVEFNNPDAKFLTPNATLWANESLVLTHHFAEQVCAVSRTSLICAVSASRQGRDGWNYYEHEFLGLPNQRTWFTEAQAGGYITGWFGKNHLGCWGRSRPVQRNVNFHYGMYDGSGFRYEQNTTTWNENTQRQYDLHENGLWWRDPLAAYREYVFITNEAVTNDRSWAVRTEVTARFNDDIFTEKALQFIWTQQRAGNKSFTYLALINPHSPMMALETDVLAEAARLFPSAGGIYTTPQIMCATRGAMLKYMDANLATIRANLPPNTLVIFTSDNGGLRPDIVERPNNSGIFINPIAGVLPPIIGSECSDVMGLRGGKGVHTGGGLLVPTFVWWPEGGVTAGVSSQPVFNIDWFPTLTTLMRGKVTGYYEGRDVFPTLIDGAENPHIGDTVILSAGLPQTWAAAVVTPNSKVRIFRPNELSWQQWTVNQYAPAEYNLHDDLFEQNNLFLTDSTAFASVRNYVSNYVSTNNISQYLGNDEPDPWHDSVRVIGEWPRIYAPRN